MGILDRIKLLCKERGIGVKSLERQLGFSETSIYKGANNMKADRLLAVANYFGVSVDYLLNGTKEESEGYYTDEKTAATAQAIYENRELSLLFDAAKDAKPEDLMTAYNVLLALKRKDWSNNA